MLGRMTIDLCRRMVLLIVAAVLCIAPLTAAVAQITLPGGGGGGGGMTPVPPGNGGGRGVKLTCKYPPGTCPTKAEKERFARENNCQFAEDLCEGGRKVKPSDDSKGAQRDDSSFWGSLWDGVKSAVTYGYEFVKGVVAGLKGQISDLWNAVTNPGEIIDGLVSLGKSFYEDPKGTMKALGEMLGQEAVDTFTRATQCGAYDLGKVIGSYVSPAFGLKVAQQLTKYGGKLADVSKKLRKDYGCASFAAGTLVLTADGYAPIETIAVGQLVRSRNENSFADRPQAVTSVFGRLAPSYRRLVTETEEFKVTDEHPLWLQGKGWTEASKLVAGDIIASEQGDTMVMSNDMVKQPLRVYNFSVAHTPNYFVGSGQVWAHNADGPNCSIELYTKAWSKLTPKQKGFRAEREIFVDLISKGYEPVGKSFDPRGMSPEDAYKAWDGQTGIDGIYKDSAGNYVILESKATGGTKNADPKGCVDKLCLMTDRTRQMSDKWIRDRLAALVPNSTERAAIEAALTAKTAKRIYAITDAKGTTYHHIDEPNTNVIKIGNVWTP